MTLEEIESAAELNQRNRDAWERNAAYWDERMAEGNDFHRLLLAPAIERLLAIRPGERVLDAACGNGQLARWLSALGAEVTAFDFSAPLIALARSRSKEARPAVDFRVLDATDEAQLRTLGEDRFDAVVCNMALMDMPVIGPLIAASRRLLRARARFVFSVPHPCFNNTWTTQIAERRTDEEGKVRTEFAVKVRGYKTQAAALGVAMMGQPATQYYFERPLEALLGAFFAAGYVLDALEEPSFETADSAGTLSWKTMPEIPPVLVARMRP